MSNASPNNQPHNDTPEKQKPKASWREDVQSLKTGAIYGLFGSMAFFGHKHLTVIPAAERVAQEMENQLSGQIAEQRSEIADLEREIRLLKKTVDAAVTAPYEDAITCTGVNTKSPIEIGTVISVDRPGQDGACSIWGSNIFKNTFKEAASQLSCIVTDKSFSANLNKGPSNVIRRTATGTCSVTAE